MSNENNTNKPVHGYKVFDPDWTCKPIGGSRKQYTCPGKFEEEGDLKLCEHGMHFCQTAASCFNYYEFDSKNKVAEVIAYGDVITDGYKSCTNKLEIIREVPWEEVLRLVNVGNNCTGLRNTGNENAGNWNTGSCNKGDWNTGDHNIGDNNTGNWNTGDYNTGRCNSGNSNTGPGNAGNDNTGGRNDGSSNTGNYNDGNWNTGDYNSGDSNTGIWNIGKHNSGNCNIGSWNTGDWNKSFYNTGCFNTEETTIMLFNKPSDWTFRRWLESDARFLLTQMPKRTVEWVDKNDMTDEEKELHSTYEIAGGYLKKQRKLDLIQAWWNNLSLIEKETIKAIPNFDPDIFYKCTGIRVD